MDNLEKIGKRINDYVSIAEQEKEQNEKAIKELYAEQDKCTNVPEELAKKGDEQGYKEARLHLEYCSDRIAVLEQRNDTIESKPLVSKQTYEELNKAIWNEYIKVERECAAAFVEYAKKLKEAQLKMAQTRGRCNVLLDTLNRRLYWTEITSSSGNKYRNTGNYYISTNEMDDTVHTMYSDRGVIELAKSVTGEGKK